MGCSLCSSSDGNSFREDNCNRFSHGAHADEGLFNLCFLGKGPNFWDLHYSRQVDGKAVHSAYLDVWLSLKEACNEALIDAVQWLERQDRVPEKILVTGYSMGGGVSSLAFGDILSFIQARWGTLSLAPQKWARDENFRQLIRHITFGEYPAGSYEWHVYLNILYERHTVPAWEFSNAADQTFVLHIPFFKSWRGHKYDLPDRAVHPFGAEYGRSNHGMSGYRKSLEWVEQNGWHDVASRYKYP